VTGASADNSCETPNSKVALFGFRFDRCTLGQAVDRVLGLLELGDSGHYVVTPNVDHAVLLHKRPELASVYSDASLVIADGLPLIWASQWLKKALPERVAGSDLVPAVFRAARKPLRVYLLGARPGIAQTAADNIVLKYPNVRIAGVQSPPVGFELETSTNNAAVSLVAEAAPDILVLGLGAPKQELWAYRERYRLKAKVILCAGATIDFLAGARRRAPLWCQRYGLEWAYRALEEPRRLVPRYAEDAVMFPRLMAREWFKQPPR
jgi:N-acetylglucosaminyldiphosphoundecaprenol N-acetyl-beta-D-mannosaminyltransferase